jgi:hypothetical protein
METMSPSQHLSRKWSGAATKPFGKNVVAGGAILTALRRVLTIPLKADDEIAG